MPFALRRKPGNRRRSQRRGLRHLMKTGLPPGIEREPLRDPGSTIRRKRTDGGQENP